MKNTKAEQEFVSAGKKFRKLAKGIDWGDGDIPLQQLDTLRESFVQKAWILFDEMIAREK